MKKILFIESRYESFYGAQKSMLKLVQILDESKFESQVVTTGDGKLKKGFEKSNVKVDVIKLGKKANTFGGKTLKYSIIGKVQVIFQVLVYNLKIANYILKNKIDFVYVNDLRALLYSVLATKILRKKTIWYIRNDLELSIFTKIGLRFSDKIITIAKGVLRRLPKEEINRYSHKMTNIYTGFDFGDYHLFNKSNSKKSLGIPNTHKVIGYLGSVNERKGLDILVDAFIDFNKTQQNNLMLLIVGNVSPGYESFWNKQLKKLNNSGLLFKHLSFMDDISKAYCAMDIFILPSRSEGLPRVVIEAIAHKIPVIATDVGGVKEIIKNEDLGLVIEKEDKLDLIKSIDLLLSSDHLRETITKNAFLNIKKDFSTENFVRNINDYFSKLN